MNTRKPKPDEPGPEARRADHEVGDDDRGRHRGGRQPPHHRFSVLRGAYSRIQHRNTADTGRRRREQPPGPAGPAVEVAVGGQQAEQAAEEQRVGPGVEGVVRRG